MQSDYLSCALRQLEALVAIPSPTGFTERVVDYRIGEFAAMGYAPKRTAKGGLTVELGGTGDGLLLSAHVDTLGAMVCGVKPGGALRVAPACARKTSKQKPRAFIPAAAGCSRGLFSWRTPRCM